MPFTHWKDARDTTVVSNEDIGPVAATLFKHMIESTIYQPLALTHVTFDNITLDCSTLFMTTFIKFQSLSELRLRRCPNSDLFLEALIEAKDVDPTKAMRLIGFEYAEYVSEKMDFLETFLQSFKGLEQLYLVFHTSSSRPDIESITHHADTLSILVIETDTSQVDASECYGTHELTILAKTCSKLRQLSVELPIQFFDCETVASYNIIEKHALYMVRYYSTNERSNL